MNKGLMHTLFVAAPFALVAFLVGIYFYVDVKSEQGVSNATARFEDMKFDDNFEDAWNGEPGSKIIKQRSIDTAEAKAEIKANKERQKSVDQFLDTTVKNASEFMKEEDIDIQTGMPIKRGKHPAKMAESEVEPALVLKK